MTEREQLEFIVRCDPTFLLMHVKENTNYDAKMLEVVFELAKEQARAALASSDTQAGDGGALYTMDQMREYADNFHLSRMCVLVAEKEAYEHYAPLAECAPRETLTDEQISAIIKEFDGGSWIDGEYRIECKDMMRLARTIEQAAKERK